MLLIPVEAIRYVDKVVPQSDMDKIKPVKEFGVNIVFVGSDWKGTDMYNKMISDFAEVGVDVVFLPHTEGVSSTLLSEVLYTLKEEEES